MFFNASFTVISSALGLDDFDLDCVGCGGSARGASFDFSLFVVWMGWIHLLLEPVAAGAFKACINLAGGSLSDSVAKFSFMMSAHPFPFGMGIGLVSFTSLFPITFLNEVGSPSDSVTLPQVLSQCHMFPLHMFPPHLIICYSKIGTFGGWLL